MSTTPRTDAEREKTYTPEYEYEGAEHVAWAWAEKLEKELAAVTQRADDLETQVEDDWRDANT